MEGTAGKKTVKVAMIRVGRRPEIVETDCSLESLQKFVGGLIEPFTPLFGDEPCLYVNEDGIAKGLEPNRSVYATVEMAEAGYVSQVNYRRTVEPGELYTVLFGDIVGVSYDVDPETGEYVPRDLTQAEFERVCRELGDPGTGWLGVMEIVGAGGGRHGMGRAS